MEKIQLEISLSDDELKTAMSRYHYEDADFLLFSQVYGEIMEQLRPVGMYVYGPFRQEFPEAEEEAEENGCQVIVSLGGWPDRLQEKDTSRGMLTESFMAECICTELLLQAYEDMNRKIREKYGLWVKKMLFPGGSSPLRPWRIYSGMSVRKRFIITSVMCCLRKKCGLPCRAYRK